MKILISSVLRYCLYGSCAIISSELIYYSYFWLKNKRNQCSSSQEVSEVIWTNELSQCCVGKHIPFNSKTNDAGKSVSSPNRSLKGKAIPSKPIKTVAECENPFCNAKNMARLIEYIDSAKYSIDLAMYTFTSFELSQGFLRALDRGILIRIISDHEMAYSSGSQIIPLTKSGVAIRCNNNTVFMHHKFCILDSPQRVTEILKKQNQAPKKGQSNSILFTGSLNWTNQGFSGNWENILITSKMEFIRKYSEEFERMWRLFDVDLEANDKK